MSRASMASLITTVRGLTGDDGATPVFTDDEIQAALDAHRLEYRYAALDTLETRTPTDVEYRVFTAHGLRYWEDDVVLTSGAYATLTPDTEDLVNGRWEFNTDQNGNLPVLIVGKSYDVYAAAALICTEWAARLARDFDFQADMDEFKRSQKSTGLLRAAAALRAKSRPAVASLVRTD